MANPTKSKHGIYYYIVRVPKDLVGVVGKSRISETLGTKDIEFAKRLFTERHSQSLKEWAALRSEVRALTHKETVALSGVRYRSFIHHLEDDPGAVSEMRQMLEMLQGVDLSSERLSTWYGKAVDRLLLEEGIRIDESSRKGLMRQMHQADVQALSQLEKNAGGDYRPDPDADRFPAWSPNTSSGSTGSVSLDELFAAWERDHTANGGVARTTSDFRHKVSSLISFLGHSDAQRVSHADLARWCDDLRHEQGKAPRTVRDKYLAAVKSIYRLGLNKGLISSNPARDVSVRVPKAITTRSKGFSDEEAKAILSASLVDPASLGQMSEGNKLAVRWVPWICAYTGARVREITQLRKEDLVYEHGIPCLRITPDAGSVKTGQFRLVPLHRHLIEMGLPDLFGGANEGPIFFTLNGPGDDPANRAESVTKKLALWVRRIVGVDDDRVAPNHGWRHRFKTLADDVGMEPKYSDAIQGHSDGKASSGYGERTVKALSRELQKMPSYAVKT